MKVYLTPECNLEVWERNWDDSGWNVCVGYDEKYDGYWWHAIRSTPESVGRTFLGDL